MVRWIRRFPAAPLLLLAIMLATATGEAAAGKSPIYSSFLGNVAIGGADPVAYFNEGELRHGKSGITFDWKGAQWRFASAENRDAFAAAPERYAPQYGGYCAWAVSQGYTASIDPEAWRIVDGKLYLNYSQDVQAKWAGNISGNIAKADRNWPGVLAE